MSITWLRVALALYALGLLYVLVALTRTPTPAKDLLPPRSSGFSS